MNTSFHAAIRIDQKVPGRDWEAHSEVATFDPEMAKVSARNAADFVLENLAHAEPGTRVRIVIHS